jgi:hypothetical protein
MALGEIHTATDTKTRISDIHLSSAPPTLLNSLFGDPRSTSNIGDLLDISTYAYQNGTRIHNHYSHLAACLLGEASTVIDSQQLESLSIQEKQKVYHSTLAQLSKTEVFILNYQCEAPQTVSNHFLNEGFVKGHLDNAIKFSDEDCFEIRFTAMENYPPNPEALLSHLDHSVISVSTINKNSKGKSGLDLWKTLCYEHFWGTLSKAFSESIEAKGVGMYTKVKKIGEELHPVIFSVETEQHIARYLFTQDESEVNQACTTLKHALDHDKYTPQYLRDCVDDHGHINKQQLIESALKNQVTQGNWAYQGRAFVQHIASHVDPNRDLGQITSTIEQTGQALAPAAPKEYYAASKSILPIRACLPAIFKALHSIDFYQNFDDHQQGFKIKEEIFAILLSPFEFDQTHINRIKSIFSKYSYNDSKGHLFCEQLLATQPIMHTIHIGLKNEVSSSDIMNSIKAEYSLDLEPALVNRIEKMLTRVALEVDHAEMYGNLVDYETKPIESDTGLLRQRFIAPINITDGFPGLFFEFIERCDSNVESNTQKGCGGFGQGNFSNLMKAQQAAFNNQNQDQNHNAQSEPMAIRLKRLFPTVIPLIELTHIPLSEICKTHLSTYKLEYIHTLESLEKSLGA